MRLSGGRLALIWARLRSIMGFDVDTILTHSLDSTGHELLFESCSGDCIDLGDFIITDINGNLVTQ